MGFLLREGGGVTTDKFYIMSAFGKYDFSNLKRALKLNYIVYFQNFINMNKIGF